MKKSRVISIVVTAAIAAGTLCSIPASSNSSDRNRLYKVYDYATNTVVDSYILLHQSAASATSTYRVIGDDDMVPYTNSGIVNLDNDGTGFIVDDHTIATAAHCVYGIDDDAFRADLQIQLYDDEGNLVDTIDPVTVHVPQKFTVAVKGSYQERQYDYALITVEEDLSDYEHFDLGVPFTTLNNVAVTVSGYTSRGLLTATDMLHAFAEGDADYEIKDYRIKYDTDTLGDQSGSPVYITTRYVVEGRTPVFQRTVIGIHTLGGPENAGVRITSELINFYLNNPNITE